jgi:probable phosphoglycerate mutase
MSDHRVYLVRHGEAAASWGQDADPGLSPLGQQQAETVGRVLQEQMSITQPRLLSSPLQRARETALPLAAALNLDVLIDDSFREIPAPVPLAERQNWLRGFMREQWSMQDNSLHQWRNQLIAAVEGINTTTVVFTHFLVINSLVGWLQQRDETLVFWPDNASVTTLVVSPGGFALETLGAQMRTRVN